MDTKKFIEYIKKLIPTKEVDNLTNEDIEGILDVVMTRDYYKYSDISNVPKSSHYPLALLCKKDIFYLLAISYASDYDLSADDAGSLKKSQRFEHYMKLIEQVDKEYNDFINSGGGDDIFGGRNTLTSFDARLANRYYTQYNYDSGKTPDIILNVEDVTSDSIAFSWDSNVEQFSSYDVRIGKSSIYDYYLPTKALKGDISNLTFYDVHQKRHRFSELEADTKYYITVTVNERSGLHGTIQYEVTTKGVV